VFRPQDGLYGRAATRLLRLPTTATRGRFLEKQPKLRAESISDMPERSHGRTALAQFETANVGPAYPHPFGKLGLRQPGRDSQPPHVPPDLGRMRRYGARWRARSRQDDAIEPGQIWFDLIFTQIRRLLRTLL
jgi:hypothetical protein